MRRLGFRQHKRLIESEVGPTNKRIEGVATYRIMDNPIYKSLFNYIEPNEASKSSELDAQRVRADLPYLCLNYSFLPEEERLNFKIK